MDLSLIIGFILAVGFVVYGITGSGQLSNFYEFSSILITIGGTFAATFMSVKLKDFIRMPIHIKIAMSKSRVDLNGYIDVLVELAQEARVKGLLALEEKINHVDIDDEFLRYCVMLIIDALEASKVREQIENEISCIEARHAAVWKIYEKAEVYAPAFGMIGTLIGLINMLADMDPNDATKLTKGMATALVTTFYGSCLANMLFAPLGTKLKSKHEEEMIQKELIMEGVLSIQAGENPKYIREKLKSYLTKNQRDIIEGSRGEA